MPISRGPLPPTASLPGVRWRRTLAIGGLWAALAACVAHARPPADIAPAMPGKPDASIDVDPARPPARAPQPDANDTVESVVPADTPPSDTSQDTPPRRPALAEPSPAAPVPVAVPRLVDAAGSIDLWPHVRVWSDDEHVANPDKLLERLDRFESQTTPANNLGRIGRPAWIHTAWEVDAQSDGRWILHLRQAALDDARVLVYEDGRRIAQAPLGATHAFAERPLPVRAHALPLELRPGTRIDILVRLSSRGALVAPITMDKPAVLLRGEGRSQLLHGLVLGLALGALGVSVVLALRRRDRMFAAHAAWIVGSVGYVVSVTGLGAQYLWSSANDGWTGKLDVACALLIAAAAAAFLRHALSTRTQAAIFDSVLRALTIVAVTGLLVAPIATVSHRDLQQLAGIVAPMILAVGLTAAWLAHRRRESGATAALVGWSCMTVGASFAIGIERGSFAAHAWTLNAFEASFAMQIGAWAPILALRHRRAGQRAEAPAGHAVRALAPDADELTGLPGRVGFSHALAWLLEQRAAQSPTTLVAVYLVTFEKFEAAGGTEDRRTRAALLVQIARRIESVLRNDDVVARLSGGDFAVAASRIGDRDDAHTLGQKLVAAFRKPVGLDHASFKLAVTVGYALAPEHGHDATRLMRRADLAMFDARQSPRSKVMRYDPKAWPVDEETERAGPPIAAENGVRDDTADAFWCDTTVDDAPPGPNGDACPSSTGGDIGQTTASRERTPSNV